MDNFTFTEPYTNRCSKVGLAARIGNVSGLKKLLEAGAPLDVPDNRRWFPIHEAAFSGNYDCLKMILTFLKDRRMDFNINEAAHDGTSALILACQKGATECVKILLEFGADPNFPTLDSLRPLISAVRAKSLESVKLLLAYQASPDAPYWNGWTSVHEAACVGEIEMLNLLICAGGSLLTQDEDGLTPVFTAAQYGQKAALELFLTKSEDPKTLVNIPAYDGTTPLYIAAQEGYYHSVDLLIKNGSDVNVLTEDGIHSVLPVVKKNYFRCLDMILPRTDKGKLFSCPEDPVYVAAEEHSVDCLKRLIDFGCPIDKTTVFYSQFPVAIYNYLQDILTKRTATPLGQAVTKKDVESVKILLQAGASMTPVRSDCFSPLILAVIQRKHPHILEEFLKNNVDLNARLKLGAPEPLVMALHSIYRVQLLAMLKSGLKVNLHNWCSCISGDSQRKSLLSELRRVFTPGEIQDLIEFVVKFSPKLPNCCEEWRQIIQGNEELSRKASSPFSLQALTRIAIRRQLSTAVLFSEDWRKKVNLPNNLSAFLYYTDLTPW